MRSSKRIARLLVGIGLVLVGLLAGILVMLVVDVEPDTSSVARIVMRVEDGTRAGTTRTAAAAGERAPLETRSAALSQLFSEVARTVRPGVVSIRVRSGSDGGSQRGLPFDAPTQNLGSGVLISPDGYIVTNSHVVEEAERIWVRLADKRRFEARTVGTNSPTDLAVIKIDGEEDFPVVPIGNSDRLQVGDWVVAIGNPFRLTSTVTAGIVSALERQLEIIEDEFRIENFIQTDAAINPGNSGGALVNLQGELVGINTAIASRSRRSEGYGFAVPSVLVERVVTDLIAYGKVRRGYLGVAIVPVDAQVADSVGLDEIRGVYIDGVRRASAADRAGIQAGDVVVTVTGKPVDSPGRLQSLIARHRPGDEVSVGVWRDGVERTFDVELMGRDTPVYQEWLSDLRSQPSFESTPSEERRPDNPGNDPAVTEVNGWDVGLRPLSSEEASTFGVESGAYVAYVESGGRAAVAGLPRDVVITHLGDSEIERPSDVIQYLAEARGPVLVQVQRRDGTPAFYEVLRGER